MESATPSIGQQFRVANELLLSVLRDESSDYEIAFICECERLGCYAAVWLTRAEYEARLKASQPIVLSGHLETAPSPVRDVVPLREGESTSALRRARSRQAPARVTQER